MYRSYNTVRSLNVSVNEQLSSIKNADRCCHSQLLLVFQLMRIYISPQPERVSPAVRERLSYDDRAALGVPRDPSPVHGHAVHTRAAGGVHRTTRLPLETTGRQRHNLVQERLDTLVQ